MATKRRKIQRTADGKYLQGNGNWGSSGTATAYSDRGSVGAVVTSKSSGVYRMVNEYSVED